MRWDEQRVENDLRLPGVGDGAITRTFDAPEAMGINFHEVRARSALNHVAGGRYGFDWTINSYRGCSHACVYCLEGETPILMADGKTRPLKDVRVGDAVYGTVRRGSHRRYKITQVRAHWTTHKPGYRVVLEDGTELIASGDHRFLTNRGWKHVTGAEQGSPQRPHLTLNSTLMGAGSLGPAVEESEGYRRGHLCGTIRGDGHVGSYSHVRPGRTAFDLHRFQLALPDSEERSRGFLAAVFDAEGSCRSIDGIAIESPAKLGVVAIEPIGREIPMYDITTGTGDFIANGVVSHNCFARRTHTYLDFNAGRDFEREIVVKVNLPELLRAELARPSWRRELVALGTNTDPYQWVESRYRMMPEILEALEAAETPVSVLTKSPLVMRDVEIFERMAKKDLPVSVNLSVPTLDEDAWRATEPHTPSPAARLDAVAELRRRGIDSGVLIAPLMPGINDHPDQVRPIVERARKAGATFLGGVALHLRDEVKDVFFAWLEEKRPDLLPQYEQLYKGRAYMQPEQRKQTTRAVRGWGRGRLRSALADRSSSAKANTSAATRPAAAARPEEPPQDSLF
jgi:DNA repair photolyase